MKHFIKCLTIYLVTIGTVHANLPPTTLKNQAETTKPTTFNFEVPENQATTTASGTRLIETGNDNVIKDPGFEGNSLQWVTYADAAGTAPVDGTGGTANVTVAYTTTSPLKGKKSMLFTKDASNRQGQGTSINFTIPDINKGKVNNIKISYDIVSGTYATGDLTMWVINVDPASATNGRVIQPSAYTIENSGLKESKFLEFQSDIDSNLYRLIIHVTSTSASAYSLRFDDVSVGLGPKIYGSVSTDWISYTPTVTTGTGDMTNESATGKWRRVGDSAEIQFTITAGAGSSGTWSSPRVSMPSGLVVDYSKYSGTAYSIGGIATILNASDNTYMNGRVFATSTNILEVAYSTSANGAATVFNQSSPITFDVNDNIQGTIRVPIKGWSSSQQLSQDADTRVISGRVSKSSSQSISNDTATVVTFDTTPSHDYSSMWESGNSGWRIKTSGDYRVVARLAWASNASGTRYISIQKNGVNVATMYSTAHPSGEFMLGVDEIIPAVAGDLIRVSAYQNSGSSVNINNTSGNSFSIQRVSGPSQIAASETVSAIYSHTSGQTLTYNSETVVNFNNKIKDSHNAVTTGASWVFTAPRPAIYQACVYTYIETSGVWALNEETYLAIRKNGSPYAYSPPSIAGGSVSRLHAPPTCTSVPLLQGETIQIAQFQNSGSTVSLSTSGPASMISITSTGNY